MVDDNDHGACVDAWLERAVRGAPAEQVVAAFEAAFTALWQRAHQTLGDVTLGAIVDRVLYVAAEEHPAIAALELDATGVTWGAFRQRAVTLPVDQLVEGVRFVLVEFLTVLGKLTGEVLTRPLRAQLDALPLGVKHAEGGPKPGPSSQTDGEDTQP